MPKSDEGFRHKSPSELRKQLQQAVAQLQNVKLAPPSVERELVKLSESEIKTRHPRRYDMYVSLLRGQAANPSAWFGHQDQKGATLGAMDIARMRKWLGALNNLDDYIEAHKSGESQTLRYNQPTVFEDMRDFVEKGGDAGYVKLPTGTGKTVLFAEFAEALDLRTLIVVPTKVLVDQTVDKLQTFAPSLDIGVVRSGKKKDLSRQCTVITTESFTRGINIGKINPSDYDLLILDEVHTALSDARMDAVRQFKNTLTIGFTATPDYSPQKGVGQLLETQIHSMSIKEAVLEEGALSGFQCILAKTETDLSNVKIVGGERYDERELEQAVNNLVRNRAAVDLYRRMFDGHLAVAYCSGIQHATDLAALFREHGVAAEVISGRTADKEREDILKKYDSGEIKVLCNSDILIAGFDQQKASVCLNLRPTLSPVVAEQRGGRVLRLDDNDEEKVAYIVDFIDKGHDPRYYPILFADVAEETALLRKGKLGLGRYKKLDIEVEGLEVETNPNRVKELVKGIQEGRKLPEKRPVPNWFDLVRDVRDKKIRDARHYDQERRNYGWPASPEKIKAYANYWTTWPDFLGVEWPRSTVTLERFMGFVQELKDFGIKSWSEYKEQRKQHGWPKHPEKIFKQFWKGPPWLETKEEFPDFKTLTKQVRDKKVHSFSQYRKLCKEMNWPTNPNQYYKAEWRGWPWLWGGLITDNR